MPDRERDAWHEAVAAIDSGDLPRLERLLAAHPGIATDRLDPAPDWLRRQIGGAADGFFARPYLLWFVAEDPRRNGRLPANIAAIIRTIVAAARAAHAATLQDQLDSTLQLVCWSGIAAEAGLQLDMIDALVDAGAVPGKNPENALVNRHVAAAEHLLARGATLTLAAALCLERFDEAERLNAQATPEVRQFSLVLAALNGKAAGVAWLLAHGASPDQPSADLYAHGTPLHHAVCSGSLDAVKAAVTAGADLRRRDLAWQATPLEWAEHYEQDVEGPRKDGYSAIVAYLRDAAAAAR